MSTLWVIQDNNYEPDFKKIPKILNFSERNPGMGPS
jgi:hypothetical protein